MERWSTISVQSTLPRQSKYATSVYSFCLRAIISSSFIKFYHLKELCIYIEQFRYIQRARMFVITNTMIALSAGIILRVYSFTILYA